MVHVWYRMVQGIVWFRPVCDAAFGSGSRKEAEAAPLWCSKGAASSSKREARPLLQGGPGSMMPNPVLLQAGVVQEGGSPAVAGRCWIYDA
jgi:hypothetical protein